MRETCSYCDTPSVAVADGMFCQRHLDVMNSAVGMQPREMTTEQLLLVGTRVSHMVIEALMANRGLSQETAAKMANMMALAAREIARRTGGAAEDPRALMRMVEEGRI